MPEIVIKDANEQQTVLISKSDAGLLCPARVGDDVHTEFSMTWTPRAQGYPIVMNQTGRYELTIEYAGLKESKTYFQNKKGLGLPVPLGVPKDHNCPML